MARKKTQGKLAKYVNTPEAIAIFCHHYGVPDDVHLEYKFWENALPGELGDLILPLIAIIEGGVRFPMDPLLAHFLDYFNLSPTQISPNIFRIVMGMMELNRRLGLDLTVHDIIATYTLRTSQSEAYSLRPRDVLNTLVNSLPDTNKNMTDDYFGQGGVAPPEPTVPDRRRDTRLGLVESNAFLIFFPKSFSNSNVFSSPMQRRNGRSLRVI